MRDLLARTRSIRLTVAVALAFTAASLRAAQFSQEELAFMPAIVQIELFKQGVLSPVDVLEAQVAQYEKTNEEVNGVTFTHFDAARKLAEEAERRYEEGTYRPLEGITVGIKDEHHDEGWVVTQGSLVHKDDPPMDHADTVVTKLKNAGAIPSLQTTVPELYLNLVTHSRAWGVTRNPWNPKYAVGASSGGSGAVLAAGYVTLATGSDMGGSIRIPAAFNGLYGYKPVYGEAHTALPLTLFSGSGPMARNFQDMLLLHNVIAGPGDESSNVLDARVLPLTYRPIEGMKIAYVAGMGIFEPSKETKKAIDKAIEILQGQGAIVDRVDLDIGMTPEALSETFSEVALAGAMGGLFSTYADKLGQLTDYAAHFVKKASEGAYGNKELFEAETKTKAIFKAILDGVFAKGYEVMILPTMPTSHTPADYDFTKHRVIEDDVAYPELANVLYTVPFNLLNWMPVINVPAGLTSQNMPVGMQIVGRVSDPDAPFRVAYAYSKSGIKLYRGDLMPETL